MQDTLLQQQTIDTPLFTLNGQIHLAKCVKCYDADSIHIVIRFNNVFARFRCRLLGIDTPELRSKNAEEKKHAQVARDWLSHLILNKLIVVQCGDFDKYGRVLVSVYIPPNAHAVGGGENINHTNAETTHPQQHNKIQIDALLNVNQQLIDRGYAYAYHGGKRCPFTEWYCSFPETVCS